MENTEKNDYIKILNDKIDSLIISQKEIYGESLLLPNGEFDNQRLSDFYELQEQINHYFSLKSKAQDRAVHQICFNQLMRQNSIKDGRKSSTMSQYVFLTINPPDSMSYQRVVDSVKSFTSLCVVKWACYVFEQRGEDEGDYRGFHCHMLFERDRKPVEVQKAIDRCFLYTIVPDAKKIKMWSRDKVDDVKNAYSYMEGQKKDDSKKLKVQNDVRMREAYGLKSMYTVGDCPLLVRQSPLKLKLQLR